MTSSEERFWRKVDKQQDCWLWTGSNNENGYGQVRIAGKLKKAHRVAYEQLIGPIPEGLTLDHLCRNPPCVNPAHLEPVTLRENINRVKNTKTHCKHGHEFTDENTRVDPQGYRVCRACHRSRESVRRGTNTL